MAGGVVEESCVRVTCWLETRSEGERAERAVAIFHFSIISMAAPPLAASPRPMSGRALAGRIASATFTRLRGGVCNRAGASVRAAASAAADPLPSTSTSASSPPAPLPRGAYVHLPFCVRKCLYCDFAVQALGARAAAAVAPLSPGALRGAPATQTLTRTRPPALDSYLSTLHAEIDATAGPGPGDPPLETLSFGGGTPSLIPPPDLARIVEAVREKWGFSETAEISMEADPGTFDAERLAAYIRDAGVTRLSIGVQSFEGDLLKACGRSHDAADVAAAIEAIQKVAPRSWSLDLMGGLPGLTAAIWARTLRAAITAGPDHISVYDLQVEAGTPFARLYSPGVAPLPSETAAAEQFEAAGSILGAAGFERYEVSNFARSPSHRSAHNALYWRGDVDWLAFGLGATSRLGGVRVARPRGVREWERWVEGLKASGGVPRSADSDAASPPSSSDLLTDIVMLRLRTADGLDLEEVGARFGGAAAAAVERGLAPHAEAGRAVRVASTASTWRLTDPAGFVVSNSIISDVFAALDV